ncbi:MAG: TolC family protein [Planctomycetota bacterium]
MCGAGCIGLGLLSLPGCTWSMARIDREIDAVLAERNQQLGEFVRTPPRSKLAAETADASDDPRRGDTRAPTTNNPAPDDLEFTPADPARDVASRLDAYLLEDQADPSDPEVLRIDLPTALAIGQDSAREFLTAQENYIVAAIQLLIQRRLFEPRLFNTTSATFSGDGTDGRFTAALAVVNELGVRRRFQNGSEITASWLVQATEDLREGVTDRYTSASTLALSGRFPLLRGAGIAARESLIQAERNLIYAARTFERFRRSFLVQIASNYFTLIQARAGIDNQIRRIDALKALEDETDAKIGAGILRDFQRAIASSDRLEAEAALAEQRDSYRLLEDRFKVRLGLPVDAPILIVPVTLELPDPDIALDEAVERAIDFRLDLQTTRDRVLDARRGVSIARNAVLPDLNIDARLDLPTNEQLDEGNLNFAPDDLSYSAGITLDLPLDRVIERLNLRDAVIDVEQALRGYELSRDNVAVDARASVRQVELARFQLLLSERQVEINLRRQRGQDLDPENVTTQERVDTQNALLSAENARDQALADLRISILEYLLTTGQLRVAPDGTLAPIGGLLIGPDGPAEAAD